MSYEVLARKLRPATFDALVGQDHVVKALRHGLDHDRLHHAYLFTGTRGVGKTTIARILAKCLNCETGVSSTPCESCSVCEEVRTNRFVDLIEVDAASRTGVDDTRELLENAQYLPTRGRYKVYLIDEVHMLSTASFNALLKTLEEPPPHVKFLLATTDPKKVPPTVLSRCLQFALKNLSSDTIAGYLAEVLEADGVSFEPGALQVIAVSAKGSMRDALSLTDQALSYGSGQLLESDVVTMLGIAGHDEVGRLLELLASGDVRALLATVAELAENNIDFTELLNRLIVGLHRLAVDQALGDSAGPFNAEELQLYYQMALVGLRDIALAPDERSGFEMLLLRLLAFTPDKASNVPPRLLPDADTDAHSGASDASSATAKQSALGTAGVQASEAITPSESTIRTELAAGSEVNASSELTDRWVDLVDALSLQGVARMIAEYSVLEHWQLPDVMLCLEQGHDTLLSDAQQQALSRAITEVVNQPVNLVIRVGEPATETPAARRVRLAAERQSEAERSIMQDVAVQNLLTEFGGRVDNIRPI